MEEDAHSEIKNVFTNIYYLSWLLLLLLLLLLLVFNGRTDQISQINRCIYLCY
jgi:hypothetical protein